MPIIGLYAQLNCSDLAASTRWFTALFGRNPDATPMEGLAEWHHGTTAGLQLFEDKDAAGKGTLTVIVDAIEEERERLAAAGLSPGEIQAADYTTICQLSDPDGNRVVLAQPNPG